jgi:uracil-DNA glycosylase
MSVSLNNIDLEAVKLKLYEKLKPSGWGDKLKTFLLSEDFDKILRYLLKDAQEGRRFTPVLKQVFRAFEECPYKDLKCVIIGQDPYPGENTADGIAFSSSNTGIVPSSLKFMFKELEATVYPTKGYEWNPDLTRWSNQGILLINSAFTTTVNNIGQHYQLWKPFMEFLFDLLHYDNPGVIYAFLGKVAQGWTGHAPENSFKLLASHPNSAAHNKNEHWDSDNLFNKITDLMWKHYKHKMIW